jgi:hypothetical protein
MLALRLKIADKKISEVEAQVARNRSEGAIFNVDVLKTPSKGMNLVPDRAQLNSREEAIKIAQFYPAGLKVGSVVEVDAPFAPDAYRIENGGVMAGPGCARPGCENIKTQSIIQHPAITTCVAAVDEELGIVSTDEFRRYGVLRSGQFASAMGGFQGIRRANSRRGSVYESDAGVDGGISAGAGVCR